MTRSERRAAERKANKAAPATLAADAVRNVAPPPVVEPLVLRAPSVAPVLDIPEPGSLSNLLEKDSAAKRPDSSCGLVSSVPKRLRAPQ